MELQLGNRIPQGKKVNFHKVMIESRAEQKYDLALYAYFKIAEERCQKS
jgi:cellobiose phosphorylase